MTAGADDTRSLSERLEGARIVHVEMHPEPSMWVLVFEHHGTDDDSGYMVVDGLDVRFNDGGDPDAWKTELTADAIAAIDRARDHGLRTFLDQGPSGR